MERGLESGLDCLQEILEEVFPVYLEKYEEHKRVEDEIAVIKETFQEIPEVFGSLKDYYLWKKSHEKACRQENEKEALERNLRIELHALSVGIHRAGFPCEFWIGWGDYYLYLPILDDADLLMEVKEKSRLKKVS